MKLKEIIFKITDRLKPQQLEQNFKKTVAFEQSWLAELAQFKQFVKAVWRGIGGVAHLAISWGQVSVKLLRNFWQTHLPSAGGGRALIWLLVLPPAAVGLLTWTILTTIPQRTSYQQFDIFTSAPEQRVLVVYDSTDKFGELAYKNAIQALEYARLNYDNLDLTQTSSWPELSNYSSLLFSTEFLYKIEPPQAQQITEYVSNGGGVAVVYRGWNVDLAPLFGLPDDIGTPALLTESEGGLQFQTDFFPGIKGLTLNPDVASGHVPYDVQPRSGVEIVASSLAHRPLAWLRRHGQGRVLFWNTALLAVKDGRGLIVQSILNVQRLSVLPIANAAVIQIDDFPAPFPDAPLEPISSEYNGLSAIDFYSQVWYPDIIRIARRYRLNYTFLIPFNYTDQLAPPFDFVNWQQPKIQLDGQQIPYTLYASHMAAQKGELGLHGYNHVSLTLENWGSKQAMVEALQAAAAQWDADNLGQLPTTYVPPHNQYDAAGAQALTEALPTLTVISGLYNSGNFERGGNREFGPEPWNPQLFAMPRATSGYNLTAPKRWAMLSQLGTMGVWTHFIHPDDVFDTPQNNPTAADHRNSQGWFWRGDHTGEQNGLYYRFLRWLNFTQSAYPWLRFVQTAQAREILRAHLNNNIAISLKPYGVSLRSTTPTFFQLRINDGRRVNLNTLDGAQFAHVYHGEGYTIYTLRGIREEVNLQLLIPEIDEAS